LLYTDDIPSPKPLFKPELLEKDLKKGVRRIMLGSGVNGIYIDISPTGLTFNGYQEGSTKDILYANIRNPIEIEWSEFERIRQLAIEDKKPKRKAKLRKTLAPHWTDDTPDEDYLDKLPIVTMNDKKFFLDPDRRERRSVDDPTKVYKY